MALEPVAQDASFAAVAVELRVAESAIAEMSFAAAILSIMRADNLYRLERTAAEISLDPAVARSIVLNERRFASLIAEAHRLFKSMIPLEAEIRALIARHHNGGPT
jgi:hypothetical protein